MKKHVLIVSIISIVAALVAGFAAIILPSLPLKWLIGIIAATGFVSLLLLIPEAERVVLFVLVLIIPFYIGTGLPAFLDRPGHVGLSQTLDVQLIDVLVLSLIIYSLMRLATRQVKVRLYPFTTVPAIVWLVVSGISVIGARNVDVGIIQIGQMVKLLLLYIVVANSIKDEADIKWLVTALLLGTLFEGILGSYELLFGGSLGFSFLGPTSTLDSGRSFGTIGSPNAYGMYLAASLPLAAALLFLNFRDSYKILAILTLGFGLTGLIFSLSRGGWSGFLVALIVVVVFAVFRNRKNRNFLVGLLRISPILLVLILLTLSQWNLITARLTSNEAIQSANIRAPLNRGAIAMIKDHPLLGVGLNNYSLFMPEYDPVDYLSERRPVIVHNVFLLIFAETGFFGVAAFLWFLASLFIQAWRLTNWSPNDILWLAGIGAFSAFTALAVHGMVDYGLVATGPVLRLLWLFAAIVAGLSEQVVHGRDTISHIQLHENVMMRQYRYNRTNFGG